MSDRNDGMGRRHVLKTSGQLLAGGVVLGSMTSAASADLQLDLENDFEEIAVKGGGGTFDGAHVNSHITIHRPEPGTDLVQSMVRVARVVLDISATGLDEPMHKWAAIEMRGENDTHLDMINGRAAVGPGNTIGSNSYSVGISAGISGSVGELGVSASRSLSESNLDIDDNTQPEDEYANHMYTFSGDMRTAHETIDMTAVFDTYGQSEWEEAIDIDWKVNIDNWPWESDPNGGYTYQHVEGDLS